ncbi:MAG: hypothetical protein N2039_11375, partial [Gemmataceae bacterium]|nr:hypothetical protein [Gemmataceae bacterium]
MFRVLVHTVTLFLLCWPAVVVAQTPGPRSDSSRERTKSKIAALFPAGTLAYAELVRPAEVARVVESILRGSIVDRLPEYLANRRDVRNDAGFLDFAEVEFGVFFGLLGSDLVGEFGRWEGAAVAVTGLDEAKEPIIVGAVLTGDSRLPGLLLRVSLCTDPAVRIASRVGEIPVYGYVNLDDAAQIPAGVPVGRPKQIPQPPFIASTPGLIVIGNQRSAVEDVVKRWLGTTTTPSLESYLHTRPVASVRHRPGLFALVQTKAVPDLIGPLMESDDEAAEPSKRALAELLSPDTAPVVAMHLGLSEGSLEFRVSGEREPMLPHPLIELVQSPPSPEALSEASPSNAVGGLTFRLSDGASSCRRITEFVDRVLKNYELSASDWTSEIERRLGQSLAEALFGKIRGITIASPARQELPEGAEDLFMWSLWAKDAVAAEEIESLVPALLSAAVDEALEPVKEVIEGHRILSISSPKFPWNAPLHYGRKGTLVVFGLDRRLVAAVLKGQTLKTDSPEPTRRAVSERNVIGFLNWGIHVPALFADWSSRPQVVQGVVQPVDPEAVRKRWTAIERSWR